MRESTCASVQYCTRGGGAGSIRNQIQLCVRSPTHTTTQTQPSPQPTHLVRVILPDLVAGCVLLEREAGALDGRAVEVAHLPGVGRGGGRSDLLGWVEWEGRGKLRQEAELWMWDGFTDAGGNTHQQAEDGSDEAGHFGIWGEIGVGYGREACVAVLCV